MAAHHLRVGRASEDSAFCTLCDAAFTPLFRKHHCRSCGALCCATCSASRYALAGHATKQRVCESCFASLHVTRLVVTSADGGTRTPDEIMFVVHVLEARSAHTAPVTGSATGALGEADAAAATTPASPPNDCVTALSRSKAPFCKLTVAGKQVLQTRRIAWVPAKGPSGGACCPWNQHQVFRVSADCRAADHMVVELLDRSWVPVSQADEVVANCRVPLHELCADEERERWHVLYDVNGAAAVGRVRIKIHRHAGPPMIRSSWGCSLPLAVPAPSILTTPGGAALDVRLDALYPPGGPLHSRLFSRYGPGPGEYAPRNEEVLEVFPNAMWDRNARIKAKAGSDGGGGSGSGGGASGVGSALINGLSNFSVASVLGGGDGGAAVSTCTMDEREEPRRGALMLTTHRLLFIGWPVCEPATATSYRPADSGAETPLLQIPLALVCNSRVKRRKDEHHRVSMHFDCCDGRTHCFVLLRKGRSREEDLADLQAGLLLAAKLKWLAKEDNFANSLDLSSVDVRDDPDGAMLETRAPLLFEGEEGPSEGRGGAASSNGFSSSNGSCGSGDVRSRKDDGLSRNGGFCEALGRGFPSFYSPEEEFERQGLRNDGDCRWRCSDANRHFELCPSYPRALVVPRLVTDGVLAKAAARRSLGRLPVLTWVHPSTRAALCRSSAPSGTGLEHKKLLTELLGTALPQTSSSFAGSNRAASSAAIATMIPGPPSATAAGAMSRSSVVASNGGGAGPSWAGTATMARAVPAANGTSPGGAEQITTGIQGATPPGFESAAWVNVVAEAASGSPPRGTASSSPSPNLSPDSGEEAAEGQIAVAAAGRAARHLPPSASGSDLGFPLAFARRNNCRDGESVRDAGAGNEAAGSGPRLAVARQIPSCEVTSPANGVWAQPAAAAPVLTPVRGIALGSTWPSHKLRRQSQGQGGATLRIIDARSESNANALAYIGKGSEKGDMSHLQASITFVGMGNTHAQRASLEGLVAAMDAKEEDWFAALHRSGWLQNVSHILRASRDVARHLCEGDPVLVHCTDGWDRTSQIAATAQILLDPFYRTISGLATLVEKEWCSFGHQFDVRTGFATREGRSTGVGGFSARDLRNIYPSADESSPIFVQWLDAVWQLTQQFPHAFEFNEELLLLLKQCVYSRWWADLRHNCDRDRVLFAQAAARRLSSGSSRISAIGGDGGSDTGGGGSSCNGGASVDGGGNMPFANGEVASRASNARATATAAEAGMVSLWSHVAWERERYVNPLYDPAMCGGGLCATGALATAAPTAAAALEPRCGVRFLRVWHGAFGGARDAAGGVGPLREREEALLRVVRGLQTRLQELDVALPSPAELSGAVGGAAGAGMAAMGVPLGASWAAVAEADAVPIGEAHEGHL